jgi:hypothetical protein
MFKVTAFKIALIIFLTGITILISAASRSSYWDSKKGWLILYGTEVMTNEFHEQCLAKNGISSRKQSARDVYKATCKPNE